MVEATSQPTAASASPTQPAPESQTPGPRASRLIQVFDQALARTLRANSYANFASCFPTPARHVPASLESVWRQLNAKLEESAKSEFEEVIAERQAVQHLNELDRLVGDARARRESEGDGQQSKNAYVLPVTSSGLTIWHNSHWTNSKLLQPAHAWRGRPI